MYEPHADVVLYLIASSSLDLHHSNCSSFLKGSRKADERVFFLYLSKLSKSSSIHHKCCLLSHQHRYSKTCLKRPLSKRPKIGFQDQLLLNAGQKYCRMLQGEHSAILLTFIKHSIVFKIFVLSIFEWPLKTGFTVFFGSLYCRQNHSRSA